MKTYCDTNVLTAFVNEEDLLENFGEEGRKKFKNIRGGRSFTAGERLKKLNKCVVDRDTLLSDLGEHHASMGAVLTSANLRNVSVMNIGGEEEGRKLFNHTCKKGNRNSRFYRKFCKDGKIKTDKELGQNNLNDVRHFGSAIKSRSTRFLTDNQKDFKSLKNFTKMEVY